ncbi:MAG TPA: hypothetical protein VGJ36_00405 [Gemmatimonadales bacterium]|jgi:hypothetical protein
MPVRRFLCALSALLVAPAATATAQRPGTQLDPARAQIHATLRAFYFNLAHHNWEGLTADILPAKVVAHRPAPETLVMAAAAPGRVAATECSSSTAFVEQANITLEGDWAEVSVPRCTAASAGTDEFRLIHFEDRWRLVYIDLFPEPVNLSTDR